MKCLDNFITSKACNAPAPKSGLYIEHLPGMSVKNIAQQDDGKFGSASQTINDKVEFAGMLVLEEAKQYILDHTVQNSEIKEAAFIGYYEPEKGYYAPENINKGIYIQRRNSPMSRVLVKAVRVLTNTTLQGKTLTVTDGISTKEYTVDLVAGEEQILDVDFIGQTDYLHIYWNTSDIEPVASSIKKSISRGYCSYCGGSDAMLYIRGKSGNEYNYSSWGIQAEIAIECDIDSMLCRMVNDLKFAILYRSGVEILKERLGSTRLSFINIHSEEWAVDTILEWEHDYKEKLRSGLSNVMTYIHKLDPNCYQKNGFRYGYMHP